LQAGQLEIRIWQ